MVHDKTKRLVFAPFFEEYLHLEIGLAHTHTIIIGGVCTRCRGRGLLLTLTLSQQEFTSKIILNYGPTTLISCMYILLASCSVDRQP